MQLQETAELIQFREEWKDEIQQRKAEGPFPPSNQNDGDQPEPTSAGSQLWNPTTSAAVEAKPLNLSSRLGDSIRLYRNVPDRAYSREPSFPTFNESPKSFHARDNASIISLPLHSPLVNKPQLPCTLLNSSGKGTSGEALVTTKLYDILNSLPNELAFEKENEQKHAPLTTLPDEVVVLILRKLDPTSIERFAAVSRKARVISLDPAIWRELVEMTYIPPQVPDFEVLRTILERRAIDFRRVYVEHPRLRMDGVYIAICQYVRPGLSENVWVNMNHLITYHRYLRFFSNGQVLSLLANEEFNPQQVVPLLKPTLRMKGLFIGAWHLCDTIVHVEDLIDASGKYHNIAPASSDTEPTSIRYIYQMTLNLHSRPLGRWNRLDIVEYSSMNIENGEWVPIMLRHERPFWFSKVRSYAS